MNRCCTRNPLALVLGALALVACSALPPPADRFMQTADLAEVVADARALAADSDPARVLVVFDIDNTLLAMKQGLGADQWYDWQKELAAHDRCDPRLAGDRLAVQGALYYASAMRPTQPDGPERVRSLQDAGFPVIALTSRGVAYRLQTFRELRRNGFGFAFSAIGPPGGLGGDFVPPSGTRPARYEDGVFLTSGQHKGAMLQDLLTLTGHPRPLAVVFVDDKQANIEAMQATLGELGIALHAWRYTGEDGAVAAFDEDRAHRLWEALQPPLRRIQELLGPEHYALPPPPSRAGCE